MARGGKREGAGRKPKIDPIAAYDIRNFFMDMRKELLKRENKKHFDERYEEIELENLDKELNDSSKKLTKEERVQAISIWESVECEIDKNENTTASDALVNYINNVGYPCDVIYDFLGDLAGKNDGLEAKGRYHLHKKRRGILPEAYKAAMAYAKSEYGLDVTERQIRSLSELTDSESFVLMKVFKRDKG